MMASNYRYTKLDQDAPSHTAADTAKTVAHTTDLCHQSVIDAPLLVPEEVDWEMPEVTPKTDGVFPPGTVESPQWWEPDTRPQPRPCAAPKDEICLDVSHAMIEILRCTAKLPPNRAHFWPVH